MIPRDNEFEVFVYDGVLVEVWHGKRLSAAQQFGEDWDGPKHSVMHGAVFIPTNRATVRAVTWRGVLRSLVWPMGVVWALAWGCGVGAGLAWWMERW